MVARNLTKVRRVDPPLRCDCRMAVLRAYDSMTQSGVAPSKAQQVATRVYRHHHPEHDVEHACSVVQGWIGSGPCALN